MSDSGLEVTKGMPRLIESPTTRGSYGIWAPTLWRRFCSIESLLKSECAVAAIDDQEDRGGIDGQ